MVRPSEGPERRVLERGRMPREIENDLLRGKVGIYMVYSLNYAIRILNDPTSVQRMSNACVDFLGLLTNI